MAEELTYFRIGLDDEAVALLLELSEATHCPPAILLASLARGVLVDDAAMHGQIHAGTEPRLLN